MTIINKSARYRNKRIKKNNQKWFHSKSFEKLNPTNKAFRKFKKSRLNIDKEIYTKAKLLSETIDKHKELWGIAVVIIMIIGMPNKALISISV